MQTSKSKGFYEQIFRQGSTPKRLKDTLGPSAQRSLLVNSPGTHASILAAGGAARDWTALRQSLEVTRNLEKTR